MRILQLSSARSFGGGERHLADLANALAMRGHEVHAALAHDSPLNARLARLPSSNVVNLPLRNALDLKSVWQLSRYIRQHEIEIVHAHMARDYPLAMMAVNRVARATKPARAARLVITRHVLFPLNRLHAFTLARVSSVIAVSEAVARSLTQQNIFPPHKLRIIPNGIDLARFVQAATTQSREAVRRSLQCAPDALLIGTVGELRELKGHEEFLLAASTIAQRFKHAHFIIAGSDPTGTNEHRRLLERLVTKLKLEGRVHFTGWLEDVAPLLSALNVFVSASRNESFGLAIVEAMACGAPVVATATEGAREIIEDEASGALVSIGDVEALAVAVCAMLEDADKRKRMSSHALQTVRERFSLTRMVEETEKIYMGALKEA